MLMLSNDIVLLLESQLSGMLLAFLKCESISTTFQIRLDICRLNLISDLLEITSSFSFLSFEISLVFFFKGKLTKEQIKAGYKALKKIEQCITKKMTGNELILACDAFYTRVPHSFGMQRPPVIRTKQEVKAKVDLLETLGDIEIAMKVMKDEGDRLLNPIDQQYLALKCEITALHRGCDEFEVIEKYTQNTHAKTHNQYKMEILNIFQIDKCQQNNNFKDVGNRLVLS